MAGSKLDAVEGGINLLNLSDDVLLYILSHLKGNDLCSLSRTCVRLQRISCDKTLWINVSYINKATMPPYLFLYENMYNMGKHTRSIKIVGKNNTRGYTKRMRRKSGSSVSDSSSSDEDDYVDIQYDVDGEIIPDEMPGNPDTQKQDLPICPFDDFPKMLDTVEHNIDRKWLRLQLMKPLSKLCPELHTLHLQYMRLTFYNPPILPHWYSVTTLSLRGSHLQSRIARRFGTMYDLSTRLPNLVCLDVGCCFWVESHCFIAISKFKKLRTLLLDGCCYLGDCVAYTSLAACLGFPAIEEIDLRDTQFGDSDLLSFKRSATIKKLLLGRQVKYVRKLPESVVSGCNKTADTNVASSSGISSGTSAGQSDDQKQGIKRKSQSDSNSSKRKRSRYGVSPNPETFVIHVDFGVGVRVEHVHEAGEYDRLFNFENNEGNLVTDEGIVSIGIDGLPLLEHLVLAGSGALITDLSLTALKRRLGLKYLDVRRTNVSKAGCISFVESCPDVQLDCDFNDDIKQHSTNQL